METLEEINTHIRLAEEGQRNQYFEELTSEIDFRIEPFSQTVFLFVSEFNRAEYLVSMKFAQRSDLRDRRDKNSENNKVSINFILDASGYEIFKELIGSKSRLEPLIRILLPSYFPEGKLKLSMLNYLYIINEQTESLAYNYVYTKRRELK